MSPTSFIDWIWYGVAGVGAVATIALVYFALLHGRSKGRRRCPRCWYDMSHAVDLRCPECGRTVKTERRLYKSHRRWRWVLVAVLLLIGSATAFVQPQVQRDGWWSIVPNRVLIWGLPFAGEYDGAWWSELDTRMRVDDLSGSGLAALIDACVAGHPGVRPPSRQWQKSYGQFVWKSFKLPLIRPPGSEPFADDLLDRLYDIPTRTEVVLHDPWPEGMPLRFQIYSKEWWPQHATYRARVVSRDYGSEVITWSTMTAELELPASSEPEQTLSFDVIIERVHHTWIDDFRSGASL